MDIKKLYNKGRPYLILGGVVLLSTLVAWLPFLLKQKNWLGLTIENPSFDYIYRNFDGLLYLIPAKTLYSVEAINQNGRGLIISLPLGTEYFAAHLPLYPFLIRSLAWLFGYLKSMLIVNILSTIALVYFFYYLVKEYRLSQKPLVLATVLLFLPRFLPVRVTGAPESLFMFLILASLFFFEKEKYWLAGLIGGLATMTKVPGVLLVVAYGLVFSEKLFKKEKFNWNWLGIGLIPLGLLAVFGLYQVQMKDFWAYFHTGGVVPMPYPFSVFNSHARWVGTAWVEEALLYFFIYLLAVVNLSEIKERSFFYFSLVFFTATVFVQHMDIARYSLPLWPLAAIAFEKLFTSKKFLLALLILLPAIYLFSWNLLIENIMHVGDWKPFL